MAKKVEPVEPEAAKPSEDGGSLLQQILLEIVGSPFNIVLVALIVVLIFKIWKSRQPSSSAASQEPEPELPKLRKDFTVEEMREFTGSSADGRILIAVNGKVFDVTKGKRFYGPGMLSFFSDRPSHAWFGILVGGPYAAFGGRDASRGLATFQVGPGKDEYDDLSDLNSTEMDSVREWEMQFTGN